MTSEAFCYRNPEYHEECEFYTYVEIAPLSYEIFKYSPIDNSNQKFLDVSSNGFDGLFRDELTIIDEENDTSIDSNDASQTTKKTKNTTDQ